MSRKHRMDSAALELEAMGVSTHPGRGWRILALLLVIGAATFVAAYYLPLYRAHDQLQTEYAKLSKAATSDRQKLADTVRALQNASSRRDELEGERRAAEKQASARATRIDRVARDLEARLSAAIARKLIRVEPQGTKLNVLLIGSSLFAPNGEQLSARGKKLLCQVASSAGPLGYEVRAQAPPSSPETGLALAASTAETLAQSCQVDPGAIVMRASTEPPKDGPPALLRLTLEAGSESQERAAH